MKILILLGIAIFIGYFMGRNRNKDLSDNSSTINNEEDIIDVEIVDHQEEN